MKYLANIVTREDKQYSRSYGNATDFNFAFASIEDKSAWLKLYDNRGNYIGKKNILAKHFHTYTGVEISERAFKMRTNKAQKAWQAERDAEVKTVAEKKANHAEYCANLLSQLPNRIGEVAAKIKEFYTPDKKENEICNRAVGCVGYHYAKHLGWSFVLSEIKQRLF